MKKIVPNKVLVLNGEKHDAPDAPLAYKCERNPDGTWTIDDEPSSE